jgi:hypothetical protein
MKIQKRSSTIFREIIEMNSKHNTKLSVLFVRALIRYSVRVFNLNVGKILLKLYLNLYNSFFLKNLYYEKYLLKINIFNIECRLLLANQKLKAHVKKKIEWSNFILKNSLSKNEKKAATQYLGILELFGYYNKKNTLACFAKTKRLKIYTNRNKKKFYIYGPNSTLPPNPIYSDCTIILTKMIDFDISNFKKSILILNSFTSEQLTKKDTRLLLKKYNKIYILSYKKKLKPPIRKFHKETGGCIASPMALGRILNWLCKINSKPKFIIEGFDFYLSKNSYSGHVQTGLPLQFKQLTEQLICQSLSDHDPLFNFLYVKNIISRYGIFNSQKFIKIMNLSGDQYLKKLIKCRNLHSLKKY